MFALSVTLISVVVVIVASTMLIHTTSAESHKQIECWTKIEAITAITFRLKTSVPQGNQKKQTTQLVKNSKIFLSNHKIIYIF
jgi:hypothetical protein